MLKEIQLAATRNRDADTLIRYGNGIDVDNVMDESSSD